MKQLKKHQELKLNDKKTFLLLLKTILDLHSLKKDLLFTACLKMKIFTAKFHYQKSLNVPQTKT